MRNEIKLLKSYSENYDNISDNYTPFGGCNQPNILLNLLRDRKKSSFDKSLLSLKKEKSLKDLKGPDAIRKQTKSFSPDITNTTEKRNFDSVIKQISPNNTLFKKKKTIIINEPLTNTIDNNTAEEPEQISYGRLKFFDETKNFGFFVVDEDNSDLFVHYDDLKKLNIPKDSLNKLSNNTVFSFVIFKYKGKHNESKKAIDIKICN